MGEAAFPPYNLDQSLTMVGVTAVMTASFKKTYEFSALTAQQAAVDPCFCQRLQDTHRQVWLSLLWGHCSTHL